MNESVFDPFDCGVAEFETFKTERNSVTGRAYKEAFTPDEDRMWDVLCFLAS
jgi:hypothetical protein